MNLIRELALLVEGQDNGWAPDTIQIAEYTEAQIGYVTRSGRAWTWNNVRSALSPAAPIGAVRPA